MFAEEEARFSEERERQKRRESFSLVDDLPFVEELEVGVEEAPLDEDVSATEHADMPTEAEPADNSAQGPEAETEVGATPPVTKPEPEAALPVVEEPEAAHYGSGTAGEAEAESSFGDAASLRVVAPEAGREPEVESLPGDIASLRVAVPEVEGKPVEVAYDNSPFDSSEDDLGEIDALEESEHFTEEPSFSDAAPEILEDAFDAEGSFDEWMDEDVVDVEGGDDYAAAGTIVLDHQALEDARRSKRSGRRKKPTPRSGRMPAEKKEVEEPEHEDAEEKRPLVSESTLSDIEGRRRRPAEEREIEAVAEGDGMDEESIGRSTALMSALVIISRVTGFFRTWGQAMALGVTVTASCYTVANNLPNQLYELVIGGMLATAFLPVYLSVKQRKGREASNEYTSNLLSIVLLAMGILTVLGMIFAAPVVWTQSFGANADFDFDLAVYFFRFFAIEIVLYALSSVISGVLNAERDYFWSNAAPIFNNLVCTSSFFLYAAFAESNPGLAILLLALGNPLGVAIQVVMQWPSLKRHGIHLTPHINLKDPALIETLSIGIPSLVVTICSFVTVSVQTSSALSVTVAGSSIAYYTRIWYTLPYSIFAVPITTAMFTELSNYVSKGDMENCAKGVAYGTSRIMFILIPFALYLMVFSVPLITLMAAGKFEPDQIKLTADYLVVLAASLPMYGVCTYQQKVCSSLRRMNLYMISIGIGSVLQVIFCLVLTPIFGLMMVPLSSVFFFTVVDLVNFWNLRQQLGNIGLRTILRGSASALVLGGAGAIVGGLILSILPHIFGPMGSSALRALIYTMAGGIPAVVITFGLALTLGLDEVSTVRRFIDRLLPSRAKS